MELVSRRCEEELTYGVIAYMFIMTIPEPETGFRRLLIIVIIYEPSEVYREFTGIILNERKFVQHLHEYVIEPFHSGDIPLRFFTFGHLFSTERKLIHELACVHVSIHPDVCLQVVQFYVV